MRRSLSLALVGVLITAALVFVVADYAGGIAGFEPDWRWASLVSLLALAIWVSPTLASYQGHAGSALLHAAIWLGIALFVSVIYVYRAELGFG